MNNTFKETNRTFEHSVKPKKKGGKGWEEEEGGSREKGGSTLYPQLEIHEDVMF